MTDTEGTEARPSDGEETQFIQPIRDYGRAETKPLDLPPRHDRRIPADAVNDASPNSNDTARSTRPRSSGSNAKTTRGRPRTGSSTSV